MILCWFFMWLKKHLKNKIFWQLNLNMRFYYIEFEFFLGKKSESCYDPLFSCRNFYNELQLFHFQNNK